jgi:hypothetical protein
MEFLCCLGRCACELQILEHFLGFRHVAIGSGGGVEFDRKGGDGRQSVLFSCHLEDATSGNTQQLAATRGNSTETPLSRNRPENIRLSCGSTSCNELRERPADRRPPVLHAGVRALYTREALTPTAP